MSTRCDIGIYPKGYIDLNKPYSVFYKHYDGYPDGKHGMINGLTKVLRHIQKIGRTNDESYFAAQFLYEMMRAQNKGKKSDGLGFGIQSGKDTQADIEYYYAVMPDRIECYSVYFDNKDKAKYNLVSTKTVAPKKA